MSYPYLAIRADVLKKNYGIARSVAGVPVWCVLKGNAYGMGLSECAGILMSAGADRFAVTEPREVSLLRGEGFAGRILLLRQTENIEELGEALSAGAEICVGKKEIVSFIEMYAKKNGRTLSIHIEADTGMGRSGFHPEEYETVPEILKNAPHLSVVGVMGHANRAFSDKKYTDEAVKKVDALADILKKNGFTGFERHLADSVAAFRFEDSRLDAVRIGSALTGALLRGDRQGLSRVAEARCEIISKRTLLPGETAGYGFAFTSKREMQVAVIPMGYADGAFTYRAKDNRVFKDRLHLAVNALKKKELLVTVNGRTCPVVGYVGMKHTLICVDGVDCKVGDEAVIPVDVLLAGAILPHRVVE